MEARSERRTFHPEKYAQQLEKAVDAIIAKFPALAG